MSMRGFAILTLLFCCCLLSIGCEREQVTSADNRSDTSQTKETIGPDEPLRFYNWEDYIGSETIEKFTQTTGIALHLQTFEDDEAIIGALQSGAISADVIVVSRSLAMEMSRAKLLQAIDYRKIPNSIHFKEQFTPEMDQQGNRYWVPYLWGTTGIVVNTDHVVGDYESWAVLWEPQYKGRIAMLNNAFEVTAAAAKLLGYPINPTEQQLDTVAQVLTEQKELLAGYLSPTAIMDKMRDGTLWAAQIYNGDGLVVADEFENVRFVAPREGTALWVDVFVIPRNAANPEKAHAFINFIHTPQIMGSIATEFWYASTNSAAEQYMSAEVLQAEEVYPPEEILEKSEFFQQMGSDDSVRRRVQIWSMLTSE